MGGRVDVVVPAHDERALIGACLRSVAAGAAGLDVRVVVVANGCTDDTADVARAAGAGADVDLIVVELAAASKPAALNAANEYLRGVPVVYLDADTVLTPGSLPALVAAMDAAGRPVLVGPRPVLVRPGDRLARGFGAVWSRLPSVEGDVVGSGCYAVNAAGRQRWGEFPDVIADDAFVRSRFAGAERRVVDDAGMLLVLPAGRELIRVLARWRQGNAELADASPAAGAGSNARAVLAAPRLWPHVPAFLWVQVASRLRRPERWARADGLRTPGSFAPGVSTTTAGVPAPGVSTTTAGVPAPGVSIPAGGVAAPGAGMTTVTPTAALVAVGGEVDEVLHALAVRFPGAGLYGGAVRRPSLRRAVAYCLGLTELAPAPPVLIRRDLLQRLGGVDGRFGGHGAVTDLWVRAERAGVTPVSVPAGDPGHGPEDVLRDEILLHTTHLPIWGRGPARLALLAAARFHRPGSVSRLSQRT